MKLNDAKTFNDIKILLDEEDRRAHNNHWWVLVEQGLNKGFAKVAKDLQNELIYGKLEEKPNK